MDLLTRSEEFVLLAIRRLGEDAYSVSIREQLSEITEHPWSLGAVYSPLERLDRRGYIESHLSEPTPERGGRHKRIYSLTEKGLRALAAVRSVESRMWQGVTLPAPEPGNG
jgi:DNA-binding PadR family transcriptional regulator